MQLLRLTFNCAAEPAIYALSLHDALPICPSWPAVGRRRRPAYQVPQSARHTAAWRERSENPAPTAAQFPDLIRATALGDRKSTRLNSSHVESSYAVFCLHK